MSDSPIATLSYIDRLREVREFTRAICGSLETEDYVVQSMPDASPTRWHLAHTTWFFETFLLKPFCPTYKSSNKAFEYLFNSYYNAVGKPYPRAKRGLLSRPTVKEVWAYRDSVDQALFGLLSKADFGNTELAHVLELGLQHEQQHQELMLTDIKHVLSCNPLHPAFHDAVTNENTAAPTANWLRYQGGVNQFGFDAEVQGDAFHFDNEAPAFEHLLQDYQLQDRLVTNAEYLEFINSGGYERAEHWLSMGWATVQQESWTSPLYWLRDDAAERGWSEFTLAGKQPLDLNQPVSHVSYFEADAFARWSGSRLPTEFEWEHAASSVKTTGNFAGSKRFHPSTAPESTDAPRQMFGDVWEWTSSQYSAYPGYKPPAGALGEYNGKFMCNQFVLRGGSCATSVSHIRPTYRNFFSPSARWQFSGIRLAR